MKKQKMFFALIFTFASLTYAKTWTLEEAITHALNNNSAIRMQMQSIFADSVRVSAERAQFAPDLSASASSGVSTTPFAIDRFDSDGVLIDNYPMGSLSMRIGSSVTIFDGRRRRNRLFSAQHNLSSAEVALIAEKQSVISAITRAFVSLLHSQEALHNAKEAVSLSEQQVEFQENLAQIGRATSLSLTRSRAQLAQTKHSQTLAQNNHNNAILEMQRLLELDFNEKFEIVRPSVNFEVEQDLNPSIIFEENKPNFPQISSARLAVESAELSLAIARAQIMPTLSAGANVSTSANTRSQNATSRQLREGITPSASLNLNIPIIDNRSTRSSVAIAQSNLSRAKILLERAERNVRAEIEQLITDINSARSRFFSARLQLQAEDENMQTVRELRNTDNITALDYATQRNNFLLALSEFTQARHTLMLSRKLLDIYLGFSFE